MPTAILVDDDKNALSVLEALLGRYATHINIIGKAENVPDAEVLLREKQPDVLFLDINMPPFSGFDLLHKLENVSYPVIFCTAYDDYTIQAIRHAAFDYILKPIRPADLQECLVRLAKLWEEKDSPTASTSQHSEAGDNEEIEEKAIGIYGNKVILATQKGYVFVDLEEIIYVEGDGGYSTFFLQNGNKVVTARNLQYYAEILDARIFLRVHKGYLVNFSHIKEFNKLEWMLTLSNEAQVPVARRRKEELMQIWSL